MLTRKAAAFMSLEMMTLLCSSSSQEISHQSPPEVYHFVSVRGNSWEFTPKIETSDIPQQVVMFGGVSLLIGYVINEREKERRQADQSVVE